MNEVIEKIAKMELNSVPESIEVIADKGVVNNVYKVMVNKTPYIFRLNKKGELKTFRKEEWCINKVREVGVPVSTCFATGIEGDKAYMILNYIEGINGEDLDKSKYKSIYRKLGEYAKKINSIKVGGYGENMNNSEIGFDDDWKGVLDWLIGDLFGNDFLIEKEVLNMEQFEKLKSRLSEMYDWEFEPVLCHGNLGVRNTIVDEKGNIHIIDWGNGAGQRAPYFELAELMTWKTTNEHIEDFIEGYEIKEDDFKDMEHEINTLIILRLLSSIKWGIQGGKPLKNKDFIEESVVRMINFS